MMVVSVPRDVVLCSWQLTKLRSSYSTTYWIAFDEVSDLVSAKTLRNCLFVLVCFLAVFLYFTCFALVLLARIPVCWIWRSLFLYKWCIVQRLMMLLVRCLLVGGGGGGGGGFWCSNFLFTLSHFLVWTTLIARFITSCLFVCHPSQYLHSQASTQKPRPTCSFCCWAGRWMRLSENTTREH